MNSKALRSLEYDKIINELSTLASTSYGKELCSNLLPQTDINLVIASQEETSDALSRLLAKGDISFGGVKDIRPYIMRLEIGSSLGIWELLNINSLLDTCLKVKAYGGYSGKTEDEKELIEDSLTEYFANLQPLTPLNNEIKRCIISEEEIADNASPALKDIRRNIKHTNSQIQNDIASILHSSRKMLQEEIVTTRNGRYCLPVKAEYKNRFKGMVHDQSSTGSTLFIEPMAIVRANNQLKELEIMEQKEIEKILADLSNMAAEHTESLVYNFNTLSMLDFIFAKAKLSKKMKAVEPEFNQEGNINLKKARHPLINPKDVVPIDVRIGKDFTMLIITGPNTGGKTVSLKTVGLLTLMGQAGLHIPAFDHSQLAVFKEVYADIGDEQSIEQSLSTFSSHMTNIVSFLGKADEDSLVLFDELGAGTDPTEGAALAMSILNYLQEKNIRTLATTHYSELKIYALSTEGVLNASCEFDVETLRPTYRLLMGIPGKSNAFAISSKLGLPEFIIDNAKNLMGHQDKSFEDLISQLDANRISLEKEREEISRYKEEIKQLEKSLARKSKNLEANKERILKEAREQANSLLTEAKDFADNSIKKYNKWLQEGGNIRNMEQERSQLREQLDKTMGDSPNTSKRKVGNLEPDQISIGDKVKVLSLGLQGTVNSLPNAKGELDIQMGSLHSWIKIKDLELIEKKEDIYRSQKAQTGKVRKMKLGKSAHISPEINLIGKTIDEAIPDLDKYLDDAYLARIPKVTVIHGRGTGALRAAVHDHLRNVKYVKSFTIAGFSEGSDGATIVEF
mgnify:CR=1 FL=1